MSKSKIVKAKLKELFEELFKKPVKKLDSKDRVNVNVYKLDSEAIYLHIALGITEERCEEIGKLIKKNFVDETCAVAIMEKISPTLSHPNELMLATWMLSKHLEREASSITGSISGLLERIMRKRNSNED